MARFLLLHTDKTAFPEMNSEQIEGFKQAWANAEGVKFIRTYVGKKGRGFCEFETKDLKTLQKAVKSITGSEWPSDLVAEDVKILIETQ